MSLTWAEFAACRDHDPEMFFPISEESATAAKFVCGTCPVRGACLRHAFDKPEPAGVWGGLTEDERRALRRGRTAADPAPPGQPARVA